MKIIMILLLLILALIAPRIRFLGRMAFALWVTLFVFTAVSYPFVFDSWFGLDLQVLIVPLIQVIMFGMGTTLSLNDFRLVFRMPVPVLVGLVLQYSIMPLVGYFLATLFQFNPEIAAGIILVGCSPGGVASNLMTYIARGNVALSVTMTACSTLLSPFMTPFLMELLAGELIPIPFIEMMISIFNMIIIPILTGILAHRILYSDCRTGRKKFILAAAGCAGLVAAGVLSSITASGSPGLLAQLRGGMILGFLLLGITCTFKRLSAGKVDSTAWIDRALPLVSMSGICLIIAIITSRSVEQLRTAGFLLVTVSAIHCFMGFTAGYWIGRITGLSRKDSRTVSFEVGMQNSGMASGLAIAVLHNVLTALPPAIFGPLMNVAGSVIAYSWGKGNGKGDC